MKKISVLVLTWLLIHVLFTVCFADSLNSGDYFYTILPDGSAEIIQFTGEETDIRIPEELDGVKVTSIGDEAFSYNKTIKTVMIPEGIVSIGDHTFGECTAVEMISIPESLKRIGNFAFQGSVLLKEAVLPAGIIYIGSNPFDRCDLLDNIELPSENIYYSVQDGVLFDIRSDSLISYPGGLKELTYVIPEWVRSVGAGAFSENSWLQELTIPDSVTELYANPFCGCLSLNKINLSSHNLIFEMKNGSLYNKQIRELIAYLWGTKDSVYTVPAGTASIAQEAFYKHKELSQINLPKSVIAVGTAAFAESGLVSIKLPEGILILPSNTFSGCENLTEVSLPSGLTTIGNSAFYQCPRLRHIEFPESLRSIGNAAFYLCQSLVDVKIPEGVKSIGSYAFVGGINLRSVSLPKSLFSIGQDVFLKAENVKLTVDRNSYAEEWAEANGLDYQYRNIRYVPSDSI